MEGKALNVRQQKFADFYLEIGNATEAAKRAGYSEATAYSIGQRLLKTPNVAAYINQKRKEFSSERIASAQEVMEFYTSVMRGKSTSHVLALCGNGCQEIVEKRPDEKERLRAAAALGKRWGLDQPEEEVEEQENLYDLPAKLIAPAHQAVVLDVLAHGHTEYDMPGGRGSGKSSVIALLIVQLMELNPEINALVLRKVADTLRDSVYAQILWALEQTGLMPNYICRVSPMEIERRSTGQKIFFRGLDSPEKAKGIKPRTGYVGVLWYEELDQFAGDAECRNVQQSALRGGNLAWVFKSWNPPASTSNWVNKLYRTPKPDAMLHHSTYLDVPAEWLGEAFIREAEYLREVNPDAYKHEYLGEVIGTGGNVFTNVTIRPITREEREQFDWIYHGVDWGYYPDPWAYNRMYYDSGRHILYIFAELTRRRCGNRATYEALVEFGVSEMDYIVCDSAEPKSVADYREFGLDAHGANKSTVKGEGSVVYSIKWLQSLREIVIDPETCPDTAQEFAEYEYLRDKNGDVISGYPDKNNHHIDAVRYGMSDVWRRSGE